jgi:hypothetical protein
MTVTITVRLRGLPAGPGTTAPAAAATAGTPRTGGSGRPRPAAASPTRTAASPARTAASPARTAASPLASLLPLAEPAVLLLAETAGLGLLGRVLLATALRSAHRTLADS